MRKLIGSRHRTPDHVDFQSRTKYSAVSPTKSSEHIFAQVRLVCQQEGKYLFLYALIPLKILTYCKSFLLLSLTTTKRLSYDSFLAG